MIAPTNTDVPAHWIRPRIADRRQGMRGCAVGDLQLVCGAGPYELDVLLQHDPLGQQLEVIGQVTLGGALYDPVAHLDIHLVEAHAATSVTDTSTDQFGEFDLFTEAGKVYGLRLGNGDDAPTVLLSEGD